MENLKNLKIHFAAAIIVGALLFSGSLQADEAGPTNSGLGYGQTRNLSVSLFKSTAVKLNVSPKRISVGSPDIADILILRSTQLYILGKDIGTTNVLLWDSSDNLIGTVNVEVTHDLESLKEKLHKILPEQSILVYSSQRNIVLAGTVSSLTAMNAALQMADGYLQQASTAVDNQEFEMESASKRDDKAVGELINLMKVGGGQQVMLEVKIAEIARSELRSIDAQFNSLWKGSKWSFGGANGGATFPPYLNPDGLQIPALPGLNPWGPAVTSFNPTDLTIGDKGLFASFVSSDFLFNMALNVAKNKGLAKILAEPTLTTLNGQEASFLSGGEFPIPVPQGDRTVTIQYKDFGVGLKFLPVVLGNGAINLKLSVNVSEISDSNNVLISPITTNSTFIVPALTKRSAQVTIELKDGQTIGIAGLISENVRETVNKFPGLGDLPILGQLFRSQSFIKGETELVIMVTPHLAKPIHPNQIRLPTDSFIEPSDMDFYLMGRMEGKPPKKRDETEADSDKGGIEGSYGQQIN
jgi:pilus assembly protein CpaC